MDNFKCFYLVKKYIKIKKLITYILVFIKIRQFENLKYLKILKEDTQNYLENDRDKNAITRMIVLQVFIEY